jgi:hypothetical protein
VPGSGFPDGRPPFLVFLPRFLFRSDGSRLAYVLKAWLLALLPTLALAALVSLAATPAQGPQIRGQGSTLLLLVVLASPILETLLMVPPLWALDRLLGPGRAALASALLWGVLHSLAAPAWGLVVWWPFLILSVAYLAWRRSGAVKAMTMVAAMHALQNAAVLSFGLLMRLAAQALRAIG